MRNSSMADDTIHISKYNGAYLQVDCPTGISYEIADRFTFKVPNYQFNPKYKARLWDGNIRLFSRRNNTLYIGLFHELCNFLDEREYKYTTDTDFYDQEFSLSEGKDFIEALKLPYEARDYQIETFVKSIRKKRILNISPTASGKSLMIYSTIRFLQLNECKRGLLIVPRIALVEQMYKDFQDYSRNDPSWRVENNVQGIYEGQTKEITKYLTISTWQSLYKEDPEYFHQFDFLIGDEAHEFKAKSLIHITTSAINTKYRFGFTGTLDGTNTHKMVLEGLFGEVNKVTTTKELMDSGHVSGMTVKCLLLKHSKEASKALVKSKYHQEIEYLILNEDRNKFIRNLALSLDGNTILFYQYVDKHGQILYDMIKEKAKDRHVFFIHGGVNVDFREAIRPIVEKETNAIIVASFGTTSTGINIRNIHNLILASPSKSRIRNLQSIGRGLRLSESKTNLVVHDIADDLTCGAHVNTTYKHFEERLLIYAQEQFQYKIYRIELEK